MSDQDKVLEFDDLRLPYGQVFQVLANPKEPELISEGLFVGCIPEEAIILTTPVSGVLPALEEGQQIVIRAVTTDGIALFATTVLFVSDTPTIMVYLDLPANIEYKVVRGAHRVSVALPILVNNTSRSGIVGVAGKLDDISLTGAKIDMHEKLGAPGDTISLKGKFTIGKIQKIISVSALIRVNIGEKDGVHSYGIEFSEGDEDTLLVLFGFIFRELSFGEIQTLNS